MKIAIFASIWSQNLWDELILKNEIKIFEENPHIFWLEKYKKIPEFIVFSYDVKNPFFTKENLIYKEYFPFAIKKVRNIFRNLKNYFSFLGAIITSKYIVIWWGGLFYENEIQASKKNLDLWLWRRKYFSFFHKKVIFYGVSIDVKTKSAKEKIKKIFTSSQSIYVRDNDSKGTLMALDIKSQVVYDPVFLDNGDWEKDKSLLLSHFSLDDFSLQKLASFDFTGKIVGLALRKGYFTKSGSEKLEVLMIQELLDFLKKAWSREIILLPHSFHPFEKNANDLIFLSQFVGEKILLWWETMQEIYDVYKQKQIDICFSMRLHSMILASVYKIPFFAFSYAKKTDMIEELLR